MTKAIGTWRDEVGCADGAVLEDYLGLLALALPLAPAVIRTVPRKPLLARSEKGFARSILDA